MKKEKLKSRRSVNKPRLRLNRKSSDNLRKGVQLSAVLQRKYNLNSNDKVRREMFSLEEALGFAHLISETSQHEQI